MKPPHNLFCGAGRGRAIGVKDKRPRHSFDGTCGIHPELLKEFPEKLARLYLTELSAGDIGDTPEQHLIGAGELDEMHRAAAFSDNPANAVEERSLRTVVERPDVGEDEAGKLRAERLLDELDAKVLRDCRECGRAKWKERRNKINEEVVMQEGEAGAPRQDLPDRELSRGRGSVEDDELRAAGHKKKCKVKSVGCKG